MNWIVWQIHVKRVFMKLFSQLVLHIVAIDGRHWNVLNFNCLHLGYSNVLYSFSKNWRIQLVQLAWWFSTKFDFGFLHSFNICWTLKSLRYKIVNSSWNERTVEILCSKWHICIASMQFIEKKNFNQEIKQITLNLMRNHFVMSKI